MLAHGAATRPRPSPRALTRPLFAIAVQVAGRNTGRERRRVPRPPLRRHRRYPRAAAHKDVVRRGWPRRAQRRADASDYVPGGADLGTGRASNLNGTRSLAAARSSRRSRPGLFGSQPARRRLRRRWSTSRPALQSAASATTRRGRRRATAPRPTTAASATRRLAHASVRLRCVRGQRGQSRRAAHGECCRCSSSISTFSPWSSACSATGRPRPPLLDATGIHRVVPRYQGAPRLVPSMQSSRTRFARLGQDDGYLVASRPQARPLPAIFRQPAGTRVREQRCSMQ